MTQRIDTWKAIPSCLGQYDASVCGAIRNAKTGRILSPNTNPNGYSDLNLWVGKKHKKSRVHALVAETFLGVRPKGHDVNHIDGNKTNNSIHNLEYITHRQNMQHAHDMGLFVKPEASESLFQKIIDSPPEEPSRKVGKRLGISHTYVLKIRRKQSAALPARRTF